MLFRGVFFGVVFWEVQFRQVIAWESIPAMGKYSGAQPELLTLKVSVAFTVADRAAATLLWCLWLHPLPSGPAAAWLAAFLGLNPLLREWFYSKAFVSGGVANTPGFIFVPGLGETTS